MKAIRLIDVESHRARAKGEPVRAGNVCGREGIWTGEMLGYPPGICLWAKGHQGDCEYTYFRDWEVYRKELRSRGLKI